MAGDDERRGLELPGQMDAFLPEHMAKRAERTGVAKASKDAGALLVLAMLAGAYVAFGATFAAAATAGFAGELPVGLAKTIGGLTFSLAYVLALVGGAELFTTNVLMVMAWVHGRLSTLRLLRAWGLVFVGNFVGAVVTGGLLILAGQHAEAGGAVGASLLKSAGRLNALALDEAFLLGLLGNTLLCLGVWLSYSARTTTDRVVALVPPVAAFYALGLEHAIAVMFYLPCAAFIGALAEPGFWGAVGAEPVGVGIGSIGRILLPVTLGNVLGGGVLVALTYWFVYLRPERGASDP